MKRLARATVVASFALALASGCSGGDGDDDSVASSGEEASALTAGWSALGNGVAYKATDAGDGVFIGYAGYSVPLDRPAAWVDALLAARLRALHMGHVYAVRGPSDAGYANRDIANTKLAAHLVAGPGRDAPFVLVGAHSSGTYVAHELFGQVFEGSR